ncbi:class A beta-lactamase [Streptomyces sioyaensis]|uniref:class A beta-lactamase n=1 Tax=Streptomyces sioyaensis TaxID=67364 RepID=UPI0037D59E68
MRGRAYASAPGRDEVVGRLRELEREHSVRLGVFARNTDTGETVEYRADEHFPICSVFKTLAAAAILHRDKDGDLLSKRIRYTDEEARKSGYAPVTGEPGNLAHGMTVAELCAATVSQSDNAAANLLLRELKGDKGPQAVTDFCRSIGDTTTQLERWEPELNSAEPDTKTDITSPRAIGRTYEHIILGEVLTPENKKRLTHWLEANTTNGKRFGEGLPGWRLADKTGGGTAYGVANDVGVGWPPHGPAIVMAVLSTGLTPTAPTGNAVVAKTATLLGAALT